MRWPSARTYPDASWNLGRFSFTSVVGSEGWPLYEFRCHKDRKQPVARIPALACPQWRGESLQGKSLLIWPEQGFGDRHPVRPLFAAPQSPGGGTNHPGVRASAASTVPVGCRGGRSGHPGASPDGSGYDFWTLLLSIPLHVGTTLDSIPDSLPYLSVPTERLEAWRRRLPKTGIRVGLVWKATPVTTTTATAPCRTWQYWRLFGRFQASTSLVCKKTRRRRGRRCVNRQPMLQVGPDIEDFADSAAIVAQLASSSASIPPWRIWLLR